MSTGSKTDKSKKLQAVTINPGTVEEVQGFVNTAEWDYNPEYAIVYIEGKAKSFKKSEISWPF